MNNEDEESRNRNLRTRELLTLARNCLQLAARCIDGSVRQNDVNARLYTLIDEIIAVARLIQNEGMTHLENPYSNDLDKGYSEN